MANIGHKGKGRNESEDMVKVPEKTERTSFKAPTAKANYTQKTKKKR